MPQEFADFSQRRALAQHLGGQGVPKLMRTFSRTLDSGTCQRMSDNRAHRL
jgi:hypothetical protein